MFVHLISVASFISCFVAFCGLIYLVVHMVKKRAEKCKQSDLLTQVLECFKEGIDATFLPRKEYTFTRNVKILSTPITLTYVRLYVLLGEGHKIEVMKLKISKHDHEDTVKIICRSTLNGFNNYAAEMAALKRINVLLN